MPRGLGANIGDEKWHLAQDKKEKAREYSRKLQKDNKKFGLMNAEPQISQNNDITFGMNAINLDKLPTSEKIEFEPYYEPRSSNVNRS